MVLNWHWVTFGGPHTLELCTSTTPTSLHTCFSIISKLVSSQLKFLMDWILTREWVCTDPVAVVPHGDTALDQVMPDVLSSSGSSTFTIYTGGISVIISENAPTVNLEGDPITIGHLWWSNKTGKMYIYFRR